MRAYPAGFLFLGVAIALTPNGAGYVAEQLLPAAHAEEMSADVLSAQLRRQGHRCDGPVKAERDIKGSRPDMALWTVQCKNAAYRMRLVPNMAAQIEQIRQ